MELVFFAKNTYLCCRTLMKMSKTIVDIVFISSNHDPIPRLCSCDQLSPVNLKLGSGSCRKPASLWVTHPSLIWRGTFSRSWIKAELSEWGTEVLVPHNQKLLVLLWPLSTSLKTCLIPVSRRLYPAVFHFTPFSSVLAVTPLPSFMAPSSPPLLYPPFIRPLTSVPAPVHASMMECTKPWILGITSMHPSSVSSPPLTPFPSLHPTFTPTVPPYLPLHHFPPFIPPLLPQCLLTFLFIISLPSFHLYSHSASLPSSSSFPSLPSTFTPTVPPYLPLHHFPPFLSPLLPQCLLTFLFIISLPSFHLYSHSASLPSSSSFALFLPPSTNISFHSISLSAPPSPSFVLMLVWGDLSCGRWGKSHSQERKGRWSERKGRWSERKQEKGTQDDDFIY